MRQCLRWLVLGCLGCCAACTGSIWDPPFSSGAPGTPTRPGGAGGALCTGGVHAGPAPLRLLTRSEYQNTVRDLLGDGGDWATRFVEDGHDGGFYSNASSSVTGLLADQYMTAAEEIAASAATRLDSLLPCDPSSAGGEEACITELVTSLGSRAYRRPITASEVDQKLALYRWARTAPQSYAIADAVRLVIAALLESPHFLYHIERGSGAAVADGVVALGPYEIASRLSYFLWQSMPDDVLFSAAAADELGSPDAIEAQVRRMLDDPRAARTIADFHVQWLDLSGVDHLVKNAEMFPELDGTLARSLRQETEHFASYVVLEGDGRLETLLSAPFTLVNAPLAALYGVEAPPDATGDAFGAAPVALDPTERAGLLTQAGLLARNAGTDTTSPTRRGKFVRERLLCQPLMPPPPDVVAELPPSDPTRTTRERYSMHAVGSCGGCHVLMDPIGFGFEGYDALGRYRSEENGLPIDDSGELAFTDVDGTFDGARALATRVSQSAMVRDCVATTWVRFALARHETDAEACSIDDVRQSFATSGGNVRDLIVSIARSDAFRHRAIEEATP